MSETVRMLRNPLVLFQRRATSALILLTALLGTAGVTEASPLPPPVDTPAVAVLTPADGAALNANTLRVQALVAAIQRQPKRTFVFNGQTLPGRNYGSLQRYEVAIDGLIVSHATAWPCGREL